MIYNPRQESQTREQLEGLQLERLQATLNRVYRNVAFYQRRFDAGGLDPQRVRHLEDLQGLPFTTREDLRESYPYDMFAVPLRDIVRIHSTSGTTGEPIVVGYTRNDLRHWAECTARLLYAAGVTEHDVVQIAFDFSLFTGGLGFHQGAEAVGATVIPSSTGALEKQVLVMKDYKTTVLACTPGYALSIAAHLEEMGLGSDTLSLRVGIFGAEPWSESMRRQLEQGLGLKAYDTYGLTEVIGPGVAGECEHREGLHVNEDHFLVEVVEPATGRPVVPGETGELVYTTLTKEAFPLIRYRSGDIAARLPERCPCGRTLGRISRIHGRTDDMIFYRGLKFFPGQIEQILLEVEGTAPHYRIVLDRDKGEDTVEILVETAQQNADLSSNPVGSQTLRERVGRRIEDLLGFRPRVTPVEPRSLGRAEGGKTRRVMDRRSL